MKRYLLILLLPLFFSCDDDNFNNRNPYIPSVGFSKSFDMNLPLYSELQYPGNSYHYLGPDAGVRGVIIFNTGSGFRAYDGACPNQDLSSCSTLNTSGSVAVCPCDDVQYNLFTGLGPGVEYPLKQYRVSVSGTVITVYN